jgi:AraC-like DNA-binding protein
MVRSSSTEPPGAALRVAARYRAAWQSRDPRAVRAQFTADGEIVDPAAGAPVRGDAITTYCRELLARYPDLVFELTGPLLLTPAAIAVQWLARTTDAHRGASHVVGEGAEFLSLKGDKVRTARVYLNAPLDPPSPRARGAGERKYQRSGLSAAEARQLAERVRTVLEGQYLYRDPQLGLGQLAAAVNAPSGHVSQAINLCFNTSFRQLLARYRVEEAKRLLSASPHHLRSTLAVGLQAGFATKSAFYEAFRRYTQAPPQAWARLRRWSHPPASPGR